MSSKSDEDLQKCMGSIKGFTFTGSEALTIVRYGAIAIMVNKLNVATKKLAQFKETAEFVGLGEESSVFKMMDCWGKFFAGIAVIASVADAVLEIIDIVDVVKQSNRMVDDLNDKIKPSYKKFFNGIKDAAKAYKEAITKKTN